MDLLVRKDDHEHCEFRVSPPLIVDDGQILVTIEKFSFTANNKSYIEAGRSLRYWDFWPSEDAATFGRAPVWGLATVVASRGGQARVRLLPDEHVRRAATGPRVRARLH